MRTVSAWLVGALCAIPACVQETPSAARTESPPPRESVQAPAREPAQSSSASEPASSRMPPEVENESKVGPPDAVEGCHQKLTALGVVFQPAEMPLKQSIGGVFTCGAHDAVVYKQGPTGLKVSPPALMTCRMALAFVGLEGLMQELSKQHLGVEIKRATHAGTYNCRKMVRFDLVSEHSYGNAIDLTSFNLADGSTVSVLKHFGKLEVPPRDPKSIFLRALGEQAYDRNLVRVSLGPYWDAAHRDHFHFDMARYRVDGSRPL